MMECGDRHGGGLESLSLVLKNLKNSSSFIIFPADWFSIDIKSSRFDEIPSIMRSE